MAEQLKQTGADNKELIDNLFAVGAHYGYTRTRRHPSVAPFIFGVKNRVEIFDLEKVKDLLLAAKEYATKLGEERKTLLFVCGKHEARAVIEKAAESVGMPHAAGRWIGGTLTNFSEIRKRLRLLGDLREKRDKGELEKYTKRERLDIDREIAELEERFGGIAALAEPPAALFVVDARRERTAVQEAAELNIPVIGLLNSDGNLAKVTYPIVGNGSSLQSITFFVHEITEAYREGLNRARSSAADKDQEEIEDSGRAGAK